MTWFGLEEMGTPYKRPDRQSLNAMTEEYFFTCPYCWQTISFVLDLSVEDQRYIEDCEVCCNPIEVTFTVEEEKVVSFQAESIEQ